MVCEDFNEIEYGFEKKGGLPREEGRMKVFRKVLEDCNLVDIGFMGNWFTWERGNLLGTNIQERLDNQDRGVEIEERLALFLEFQHQHLLHTFSDHCPLLINTKKRDVRSTSRSFKFEAW